MHHVLRRYLTVPAFLLLLVGAACSSGNDSTNASSAGSGGSSTSASAAANGGIGATEKDFSITLDSSTASAGPVSFDISNQGPSTHEFVVFKTDLPQDKLPLSDDGTVNEDAKGLDHIDEEEDLAAGSTANLSTTLKPGSYVVICNLPGHYAEGMHAELTVS